MLLEEAGCKDVYGSRKSCLQCLWLLAYSHGCPQFAWKVLTCLQILSNYLLRGSKTAKSMTQTGNGEHLLHCKSCAFLLRRATFTLKMAFVSALHLCFTTPQNIHCS